jgi:dipeptidyl aminopeptidase/acylaminoacyl peptidase
MKRCLLTLALVLGLTAGWAIAQDKRPLTPEDLWNVKRVSGPALSPDGTWLAVTVTSYSMETNESASAIWLIATDGSRTRQLTNGLKGDSSPVWSPDGTRIAFISGRAENGSQVYMIPVDGGEAQQITTISTGASSHKFSPDGTKLYFISNVWPDLPDDAANKARAEERKNSKVKAHVIASPLYRYWNRWLTDGRAPMLFVQDLASGEVKNLMLGTDFTFDIANGGDFDISPDGQEIAFTFDSFRNPGMGSNTDIYVMPAAGGEPKNITAGNPAGDFAPRYAPDGKSIIYFSTRENWMAPDYNRFTVYDRASGSSRVLSESFDDSPGSWEFAPDGRSIYFTAAVDAREPVYQLDLANGAVKKLFDGNSMTNLQVAPDDTRLYFSRQSMTMPATIFAAAPDGSAETQLSHFNDELLANIAWHSVESVEYEGAGGDMVQMFLLKPPGFDPTKKYPLVVLIHGGPHGNWADDFHFRWNAQLFASPGYVAITPNFHGSNSFGQKFFDSIAGGEGDKPYVDVMKAVDYMLAQGYIDEKKIAAGGGSYGGYLTNWIATQTDRFACLFTHAGNFNHQGMFASDVYRDRERRWGGFPWDNQANTDRWSPNRFAGNIKTPMLILHGELDYRVVVTNAFELYNTLQIRNIPSRMVIWPDEGHWILKPQNAKLWWKEVFDWMEQYLGDE